MKFEKKVWLIDSFSSKRKIPNWFCPVCSNGILQKDKESINTFNTVETNKGAKVFYDTNAIAEFKFSGYLKCNFCSERIVIAGYGKYFDDRLDTEVSAKYMGKRYPVYFPTHFQPELVIFKLPDSLTSDIKSLITKSFGHYWYDLDACANKIRQALERIVEELKAEGDNLDKRIKSLTPRFDPNVIDTMLAIKHIGNDGSHAARPFNRSEILDAYILFEDLLGKLYPDTSEDERKAKLIKKINADKGIKQS